MTWYQSFSLFELLLCGLFLVLYGSYLFRIKHLAAKFSQKPHTIWVKFLIRNFYFALLIIALLGPSFGAMKKEIRTSGKDIFIAVDLSASMNATDVQPSRLEKVKNELRKLVRNFNSDRIGLIIFSSEAFVQCPLTYDQNALLLYIETLNSNLVPETGTDFSPALQLALSKFKEEKPGTNDKQKAQVIVLISDGEDFGEETEQVVAQINKRKIKLFTLGVGTEAGGTIQEGKNLKKDAAGEVVVTRLNAGTLSELANETQGQYYEINDRSSEVSKLINAINNIEGELRETKTIDVTANKYFYPLLLALFFIFIDLLFTVNVIRI